MKKRILAMMLVVLIGGDAHAAVKKTAVPGAVTLDPIVVSARQGKKLSEIPSGVTVIGASEIAFSKARSIPDLLKDTEGIYTYDSSGVGLEGRINMRGFWGGMTTQQLVLVDGVPQNNAKDKLVDWALIPLDNIKRVEIIRGPGSAVYGDTAMSGVINIVTKDPADADNVKASFSYANFNTIRYDASTAQGFTNGEGYYLDLTARTTDGFREDCDYRDINVFGKWDYINKEKEKLRISADYHGNERGAYPWALTEAQLENNRRQPRPGSENDESLVNRSDVSIKYNKDIGEFFDSEGLFYYKYMDEKAFYTSGSSAASTVEQSERENTYGLLFHLDTTGEVFDMKHSLVAGIDLELDDFRYKQYKAPHEERGKISSDYRVGRGKVGPYLQDEINIRDIVRLILGVRYDLVGFDFSNRINKSASKKRQMTQVSPSCGIVYNPTPDADIYGNYTHAFTTPTLAQMFTYGSSSNPDLNPEKGENFEIGVRYRCNNRLRVNADWYWMGLVDEIWYDSAVREYENYGRTVHTGVETGVNFIVFDGMTIFFNYAYTDAKNQNGIYKGKHLTNVPIHKGSLGGRITTDFGFEASIVATRVGSSYLDPANYDKLSPYTTVDAKFGYEYKFLSVFLVINNLLNEEYNSYGFKKSSSGVNYFSPAPGRNFELGVSVKF